MGEALKGRTVAVPETRQLDVLAKMLEDLGARVLRCPMVGMLDAPDTPTIEAWLAELGEMDDLILLTGEGLRRLLGFARRANIYEAVVRALAKVRKITRGPKPARALGEIGLKPDMAAAVPTTQGIIAMLREQNLAGRKVGVQLYGSDPNVALVEFLEGAGAVVRTVAPYVYAPASDDGRVLELITQMEAGVVDVIAFTSQPQVVRLWEVAGRHGAVERLERGLRRTRVAALGPVVAAELARHGASVSIGPAKSFFMKPLVNEIVAALKDDPGLAPGARI